VSQYQKGKTNLDFIEARDSEWQWNQLGCMQVCTSLQTDKHTSTPPLSFLQAGCPSCRPTNSVKALQAQTTIHHSNNNNDDDNYDNVYGTVIMTKVNARVHPVHLMNVDWPPTLRPSQSTWAVNPPKVGSNHPHPPSPLLLLLRP